MDAFIHADFYPVSEEVWRGKIAPTCSMFTFIVVQPNPQIGGRLCSQCAFQQFLLIEISPNLRVLQQVRTAQLSAVERSVDLGLPLPSLLVWS